MTEPDPALPTERSQLLAHEVRDDDLEQSATGDNDQSTGDSYSSFSRREKGWIVFLVAISGFLSPLSAFIYFPALTTIGQSLGVNMELMNLTVTIYLLMQAISPSIFGDLSEKLGRRPIYLTVLILYVLASLGIVVQTSYRTLLVLRMLQSAGVSCTVALAYGVIADIAPPHERGGYIGVAHAGFNSATSLGPILGGLLVLKSGWRSIFWFLAAISSVVFGLLFVALPETNRALVGNGNSKLTGIYRPLIYRLRSNRSGSPSSVMNPPRLKFPNILPCFRLMAHKDSAIIMLTNSMFYTLYSCAQASLAPLLQERYDLDALQVGFCYLAFGSATAVASYGVGKIADHDYQQVAKSHNLSIDRVRGDDLDKFPIEKARLRTVWLYICVSATATLIYGWTLEYHTPLAISLVMQFLVGLSVTGIFNTFGTLLTDLYSEQAATASAAMSIARCTFAAVGVSVLQILLDAIGPGLVFTIIAVLCFGTIPILWIEREKGWSWRLERRRHA